MRTLSNNFLKAMFDATTNEVIATLIEIDHESLDNPLRFNDSGADLTSNGNVYTYIPFYCSVPSESDSGFIIGSITIENVSRALVGTIRSLTTNPTITIKVVLVSDPDNVEIEFLDYNLVNVTGDKMSITGNISIEDFSKEPFPGDSFLPSTFPGLF